MERIGIAASKIAKGNLLYYNLLVILLAFLCSLLLFIIAGAAILFALIVLGYLWKGMLPYEFGPDWLGVIRLCMVTLTVVVSVINIFVIIRNLRLKRDG